ncbi:MAG: hypothetical protein SEPTF4163_003825 [Sporothrix epigloea]
MSIPLRQIPDGAIHALAVVLSLPPDRLERIGTHHRAKPAASWLSEQETRIPGLPHCFQIPSLPHISVKVGQVTKRVILAASGGADTLAAKAAVKGIHVDTILHPRSTPTVLCASHRDLHPTVLRDMFYYLSREVADHADLIRRHPHGDDTSHNDNCSRQWREVHDWGLRMIGMSALWCTPHTFRALERGRQPPVPGYRPRMHNNTHSCTSNNQPVSSSASTCTTTPVPAPQIRSGLRLPHLEFPCEACVLAVVGARSQSLIDLRASMLSRMALDAYEKARRAKRQAEPTVRLDEADRYPNLWPLIESYITVMGMEYGEEVAEEIRLRSVALAQALFRTRACESRRQRHQARELRRLRSSSRSTKQIAEKKPPRMVTNRGHRLPLPLVPLDKDLWAHYNESIVGVDPGHIQQHEEGGDVFEVAEDNMNNDNGEYGNRDLYFVVQDCQESLLLDDERNGGKAGQDGELTENPDCDAYTTDKGRIEASVVESFTKPYWEDDYIRHILDSQTVISSAYDRPPARCENHDDDVMSYVTISAHTEAPASVSPCEDPALPSTQRTLSASSGTPATSRGSGASSGSITQRSTASSHFSQTGKTVQDMQNMRSHRTASPTSSQTLQVYPPAPASSIYSQPEPSTSSRPRVDPVAPKSGNRAPPSSNRSRAPTTTSSRPSGSRSTAQSVLRSSCAPCSPFKAPSTVFVPPSNVRTPASTKSYLQQQADLAASFSSESRGSSGSSDSSRTSSTVLSPATQSTTNTSVTYHSSKSHLQAQSQTSSQTSRTTRTAKYTSPSTVTAANKSSLSRILTPPKTKPCKTPSVPHSKSPRQPSAISTVQSSHAGQSRTSKSGASTSASASPLATLPKTTMRTHSRPTASPSIAPSNSHLRKATSPVTPLASRPVNQATPTRHLPSKAQLLPPPPPAIVISNAKTAQWACSAPSTFAWDQPSPSLDSSYEEMLVAKGRKGDYLVLPDDSISVVAKADRKAQREKQKKDKPKAATPTRNLNLYQPAKSRGPPQAAPPASSLSLRPQNRRPKDAPTAVPPPQAISSRTPCYQEPPGSLASSCSTSSSRLVSTEARRSQTSQTSQVTQWPSQRLMV